MGSGRRSYGFHRRVGWCNSKQRHLPMRTFRIKKSLVFRSVHTEHQYRCSRSYTTDLICATTLESFSRSCAVMLPCFKTSKNTRSIPNRNAPNSRGPAAPDTSKKTLRPYPSSLAQRSNLDSPRLPRRDYTPRNDGVEVVRPNPLKESVPM